MTRQPTTTPTSEQKTVTSVTRPRRHDSTRAGDHGIASGALLGVEFELNAWWRPCDALGRSRYWHAMFTSAITRRHLLGGGAALVTAGALDAIVVEPHWLEVSIHDVPVAGLPAGLEGFTIAQVTDAHLRGVGTVEEKILHTLRTLDVQLLALTGDIVDSAEQLATLRTLCNEARRPGLSAVATLGNWEHWARIPHEDLLRTYENAGVKLLVNESLALKDGPRVTALDDSTAGEPKLSALDNPRGTATLLLTHSPVLLDRIGARSRPFSLALSGHTHGGQVRLGATVVPFVPKGSGRFVAGWYEYAAGRAYVSRGTGTSLAPVRFTCRPELPIFRLRRA